MRPKGVHGEVVQPGLNVGVRVRRHAVGRGCSINSLRRAPGLVVEIDAGFTNFEGVAACMCCRSFGISIHGAQRPRLERGYAAHHAARPAFCFSVSAGTPIRLAMMSSTASLDLWNSALPIALRD